MVEKLPPLQTTFPFDVGSRVEIIRHTSGYLFDQKEIFSD
jgi:hypothetical protein